MVLTSAVTVPLPPRAWYSLYTVSYTHLELTIFRRRKIGFVFQAYNLVPVLSAYENIILPIQLDGGRVDKDYVGRVIEALGLELSLIHIYRQAPPCCS